MAVNPPVRLSQPRASVLTNVLTSCNDSHMTTNTATIAQITLTSASGKVVADVNGKVVATVADKDGFIAKMDAKLRAAKVYRETGYVLEGGAFLAAGRMLG